MGYFDKFTDAISKALRTEKVRATTISDFSVEKFLIEGRGRNFYWRATNWVASQPAVVAGSANSLGATVVCRPGKKIFVTSIDVDLSGGGQVEGVVDVDATNNWQSWVGVPGGTSLQGETRLWQSFDANGGTKTKTFTPFILQENSTISFQYRSKTTTGLDFTVEVHGVEIPNEPHLDAEYKIGIVGDSTAWGANLGNDSLGRAYLGRWQWSEVFRDQCRANGIDAQIFFNDAEDGKTMMEGAYRMLVGYTRVPVDALFISYGHNDAITTKFPTEARFKEAAMSYILERNRWNPGKPVIFLLPVLTDEVGRFENHPTIRSWITQVAQDVTYGGIANKVYLVDQSQAITVGNADYKEQAPGLYVHPNGSGSTKIGLYLWSQMKGPLFGK